MKRKPIAIILLFFLVLQPSVAKGEETAASVLQELTELSDSIFQLTRHYSWLSRYHKRAAAGRFE